MASSRSCGVVAELPRSLDSSTVPSHSCRIARTCSATSMVSLLDSSITGEFTMFRLPESINEDYGARYYDFDLYGTVNFTDHIGVQAGYRSLTVFYKVETDTGDLKMKGLYFGAALRF